MQYIFDIDAATKIGVNEAVMLQNIYFWVNKNEANNKNFYDNHYWTYNSVAAYLKQFPFWSRHQIARILKNLEDEGLILTGNYNKISYDRTKWYAVSEKGKSILLKTEIHLPKNGNGISENRKPIPDVNTDVNKDNNTDSEINEIWNKYPLKKGKADAYKKLPKLLKKYSKDELIRTIERYDNDTKDKKYLCHGGTFFNGKYVDYLDENYSGTSTNDKLAKIKEQIANRQN